MLWLICHLLSNIPGVGAQRPLELTRPSMLESFKIVRASSYLVLMLVLVALTQIIITLVDFEYNQILELTYPETDMRTGIIGKIYAIISAGSLLLHAATGVILRVTGVPLTLLAIPLLIFTSCGVFIIIPVFIVAALMKITGKCFDYTLFRAAKEILYIPLDPTEKTAGKSIVDMLTYRIAKGGASLLLLFIIWTGIDGVVMPAILTLVIIWFLISKIIARRFRDKVSREQEMG